REDARDILVEIFLAALEGERFRELRSEEQRSWLWRVARNKVADYYRVAHRHQHCSLDEVAESAWHDEEQAPEQSALRQEEHAELRLNIQHLSPIQQQVLHLRFVSNLSCNEIAHALGKREGAVRTLLSRTMNRLRSIYDRS
ncbi:MAG TPA: RNA polymerase sigma factor, partial [Ktedonobacteraceae bacterium]|nr:RNA polymerase sigma factor [Ktedonobacteraceae bacterium]